MFESPSASHTYTVAVLNEDKPAVFFVHPAGGVLNEYPLRVFVSTSPNLISATAACVRSARNIAGRESKASSRSDSRREYVGAAFRALHVTLGRCLFALVVGSGVERKACILAWFAVWEEGDEVRVGYLSKEVGQEGK